MHHRALFFLATSPGTSTSVPLPRSPTEAEPCCGQVGANAVPGGSCLAACPCCTEMGPAQPSCLSAGHWAVSGTCYCRQQPLPCRLRGAVGLGSWPPSTPWLPSLMEEHPSCCSPTMLMIKSALSIDMTFAEIVPFSALLPVLLLNCYAQDNFLPCSPLRKTFRTASSKVPYKSTIVCNLVPY